MFSTSKKMKSIVNDFHISRMMQYSLFVPRLYNLCRSMGFEPGHIMPSRAFCSDENQGFPIILITKHFGTFPFNHGMVGGIVATDRHASHADHGKDLVIIQASHVGYDPDSKAFGSYTRSQTPDNHNTKTCGKIGHVIQWYIDEYEFAQNNIFLSHQGGIRTITIDNQLLDKNREEGLFLDLEKLITTKNGQITLLRTLSTSSVYTVSEELSNSLPDQIWATNKPVNIGQHLEPELFVFKRNMARNIEDSNHLENNLIHQMPWIVTAHAPMLVAAQINTQVEFDRTFRTIAKTHQYQGKRLLFISCLNIDISPQEGQLSPLTKCIPWAAYIQDTDGNTITWITNDFNIFTSRCKQYCQCYKNK